MRFLSASLSRKNFTWKLSLIFLTHAALFLGSDDQISVERPRKVFQHPPTASHFRLPDGRNLSYTQQGVPAERARFPIVAPHSFLSSRLAGTVLFPFARDPVQI